MSHVPQGPAADLEQVIRRYADAVYRLAYARMHESADAEDVFQDVFLRYAEKAPAFRDEEHRKAWLLRVTINRCKSLHRAAWRKRRASLEVAPAVIFPTREETDLDDALRRLSPKHRTVIHLHYYENYSTKEIAEVTGQKAATVRVQLARARAALKDLLEGGEP